MKRQWFFTVTMGTLVLGGLFTGGCVSMGDPSTFAQSAGGDRSERHLAELGQGAACGATVCAVGFVQQRRGSG